MTKTIDINNKKSKVKIIAVTMLMIIASLNFINSVYAYNMTSANLYNAGECGDLLTYKGTVVKTTYIEFIDNGRYFPAYCLDKTKPGVETQQYSVNVSQAITDVGLWKIIINGHPYKSLEELQVANVYEAFAATKHAIYCYIHGNKSRTHSRSSRRKRR